MAAATALLAVASVLTVSPGSARAVSSSGHGVGYLSRADNISWLGSYRMADGRLAFCLEAGKRSPVGNDYATTTADELPGYNAAATAKLAYIARTWADSTDRDTAAAGQLAVWSVTGLVGHSQEYYAARANERATIVLNRARAMLVEAEREATTSISARMHLSVPDDRPATILPDLVSNRVGSGATQVPANSHQGAVVLVGATFTDGTTRKDLPNGVRVGIRPRSNLPNLQVRADVVFSKLPFGRTITYGHSAAGSQALLFSAKGNASTSDSAGASAVSPLPFQPRVVTQTSDATATAGAELTDRLVVSVAPGEGLLDKWGVYRDGENYKPVPVTVKSRLLGPFAEAPVLADAWPEGAPTVCEVATQVVDGPTTVSTRPCTLPASGHYVWVESIDPADTPVDRGRDRVRPWKSPFGTASEVTVVPEPPVEPVVPTIRTRVETTDVVPGTCVSDGLDVSGLDPDLGIRLDVESILVGPLSGPIDDGTDLSEGFDGLPVAGRVQTEVTGSGSFESPCIEVVETGHYVFVFRSEGSAKDATGRQVVPPFSDLVTHRSEMVKVLRPDVPTPPPSTPPITPPTPTHPAPPALAFTGSNPGGALLGGLGALSVGAAAVAGTGVARFIRSRRNRSGTVTEAADDL